MATIKQLIEERIERLDSVPDKLQGAIEQQQERVFKQLLKDLNALEVEDGKYVASKNNLAKIAGITEKLKQNLLNKDYLEAIKTFAIEIQAQARLTNKIMTELGDFTDSDLYKAVVKKSQQNALLLLDENAIASEIIQPLSDLLTNSVVSNVSYLDAVESLKTFMVGNGEVSGKFSQYAATYVKDAFAVSDRQYAKLVSEDIGFEFFEYSGAKTKGSRYFCCVRKEKIFHKKEIEEWGNDKSLWNKPKNAGACSDQHGGGRNPNTNSTTIFSYLGGYGCVDVLIPVATKYVPKDVIERAIAKGYYKEAA